MTRRRVTSRLIRIYTVLHKYLFWPTGLKGLRNHGPFPSSDHASRKQAHIILIPFNHTLYGKSRVYIIFLILSKKKNID